VSTSDCAFAIKPGGRFRRTEVHPHQCRETSAGGMRWTPHAASLSVAGWRRCQDARGFANVPGGGL